MYLINHIKVSPNAELVTVGSGTLLINLLNELHKYNQSLIQLPSYGGITIGGALGTGSQGSSLNHPTAISDQVVSMVVVDGTGKIRNITDKEHLKAFRVHLGLLGVVYEVTLKTVPQFKLSVRNYPKSDKILTDDIEHILNLAEEHDWFQFWWFPTAEQIVISQGAYVNVSVPGCAKTHLITNLNPISSFFIKRLFELAAATESTWMLEAIQTITRLSLFSQSKIFLKDPVFSEDGTTVQNPATGYSHEMLTSGLCNPCAWDHSPQVSINVKESSISVDIKELPSVIKTLTEIFKVSPMSFPLFGILFRFSNSSDALLQMQRNRKSVTIDFATPLRFNMYESPMAGLSTWQAIQQVLLSRHEGRASWSKNGRIHSNYVVAGKSYGKELNLFLEYMKLYDPKGIFMNEFGRRLRAHSEYTSESEKSTNCALLDNCICEMDKDCGPFSTCTKLLEFSVCKG